MKRIMFVCKKNSARSQMAEGFAKVLANGSVSVVSSGLEASQVRPEAIAAMDAIGIDIREQTSDAIEDFNAEDFNVVISLCGCGVDLPDEWVARDHFEEWQCEDPAENPEIFPRIRDEIKTRVTHLVSSMRSSQ